MNYVPSRKPLPLQAESSEDEMSKALRSYLKLVDARDEEIRRDVREAYADFAASGATKCVPR